MEPARAASCDRKPIICFQPPMRSVGYLSLRPLVAYRVDDLRDLPLIERKQRLARLLGRAKRQAIQFVEHLTEDGPDGY